MTLPLAQTIERFAIAYASAQGVRWADVSAETARNTRAGVSAGLMACRGDVAAIGDQVAQDMLDGIAADLRLTAADLERGGAHDGAVQSLRRMADQVDSLKS